MIATFTTSQNPAKKKPVRKKKKARIFWFWFSTFISSMVAKIWLNYFPEDCHFDYITKSCKEKPVSPKAKIFWFFVFYFHI